MNVLFTIALTYVFFLFLCLKKIFLVEKCFDHCPLTSTEISNRKCDLVNTLEMLKLKMSTTFQNDREKQQQKIKVSLKVVTSDVYYSCRVGHYYGCVKFKLNNISLYTKSDSEGRWSVSL